MNLSVTQVIDSNDRIETSKELEGMQQEAVVA
jgi:hypothetical protein